MTTRYTTQPGGFYGGGVGNEAGVNPPAARFNPYLRSDVAGNPFGPAFQIPSAKPSNQPTLPGENKKMVEDLYGRPGPQPMPGTPPLGLPMAMRMGIYGAGNIAGLFGQDLPPGFVRRTIS